MLRFQWDRKGTTLLTLAMPAIVLRKLQGPYLAKIGRNQLDGLVDFISFSPPSIQVLIMISYYIYVLEGSKCKRTDVKERFRKRSKVVFKRESPIVFLDNTTHMT